MSDTNEDRLLSDLLCQIAKADAHLTAPDEFARRVMAAWDTRDAQPPSARRWPIADGRWTMADRRSPIADYPWAAPLGAAAFGAAVLVLAVSAVMRLGPTATPPGIDPQEQRTIATAAPQPTEVIPEAKRPS